MTPRNPGIEAAPLVSDWVAPAGERMQVCTGRAELGQGAQTALLQMAAWELGMPAELVDLDGPDTGASPDEGYTAGSLSIMQGGTALRAAASALRVLVLAEAARRLNADAASLSVEGGQLMKDGAETGLSFAALAAAVDRDVAVADHAAPRGGHGPELERTDLRARMVGAPFVHDLAPEGCLAGRVLHPPTLTARPAGIEGLGDRPGVVQVVRNGGFLGLLAETEAAAAAALDWAEARVSWQDDAPDAPSDPFALIDAATGEADEIRPGELPDRAAESELTVRRQFLSHGAMGPSAALALWKGEDLTVWTHGQGVYPLKRALAQVLGADRIRTVHVPGAGCYGHNGADDAALEAALLARAVPGRPVRLTWSRASEFRASPLGTAMTTRVRVWAGNGRLEALDIAVTSPPHATRPGMNGAPWLRSGALLAEPHAYAVPADLPMARGGGATRNSVPLYAAPARVTRRLVLDLPWRTSALRALGAHLNVYGIETAVEAAFIEAGIDPFEGRRVSLSDDRAVEVLDRLEEMAGDIRGSATDERGWGIALARYKNTAAWAAVLAEVTLGDELRVPRVRVAVDTGEVINADGVRNQVEGGVIQALSWTLKEAVSLDGPRIATAGWEDYPILRFSEVPRIETALVDRPDLPPLGVAEALAGPTAAAVGNAVLRLIGVPVTQLPITRDAVIAAVAAD
jgi:CO/xanthine dehydrogenase Mo-binding subunit